MDYLEFMARRGEQLVAGIIARRGKPRPTFERCSETVRSLCLAYIRTNPFKAQS